MAGFTTHTGKLAVYNVDDVDTDRIIPARFLSRVSRSGYGDLLFKDVRSDDFPLDQEDAKGASILVAGNNFGCGSSREHAVWAIQQAGFVAVVGLTRNGSPGYSDIFRQNAANCGLLLVELAEEGHSELVGAGSGAMATIDLPAQTVTVGERTFSFEIDPAVKNQLVAGLDLIGTTLLQDAEIGRFESEWSAFAPIGDTRTAPGASN
ncbi:MAG TPA: 3-isopropylmalate dehydratase small subunit [Fimbriimonadaceae bacterium]|nr:3-isopropylmalate dehydratase small subunit [Fimbriimonadaceae bacterium]